MGPVDRDGEQVGRGPDDGLVRLVQGIRCGPAERDDAERQVEAMANDDEGYVRGDDERVVRADLLPTEDRAQVPRRGRDRVVRVTDRPLERGQRLLVQADGARELQLRPVRMTKEDHAARRADRPAGDLQDPGKRGVEVRRAGEQVGGLGQGAQLVFAGRAIDRSFGRHASLLAGVSGRSPVAVRLWWVAGPLGRRWCHGPVSGRGR